MKHFNWQQAKSDYEEEMATLDEKPRLEVFCRWLVEETRDGSGRDLNGKPFERINLYLTD